MKISVITVAYNAAATIADTLRSVAAQDYPHIEHVIIDGASIDNTAALVAAHGRPGTIFHSAPDDGLYDAMNKGLAAATGDIIGFLNADDFFCRTDAIDLIVRAAAANPQAAAVSGAIVIIDEHDINRAIRAYSPGSFAPWMLRFGQMPPHPAFYARRAAFNAVGGFDSALRIGADFEWMVRFFHNHRLSSTPLQQTLTCRRQFGPGIGQPQMHHPRGTSMAAPQRHRIRDTADRGEVPGQGAAICLAAARLAGTCCCAVARVLIAISLPAAPMA